MKGSGYEYG